MHTLWPEDDEPLAPAEVVERLQKEFRLVTADKERGRQGVERRIARRKRLNEQGKNPTGTPIEDQIAYLESLMDEATWIVIADDEKSGDAFLATNLLPGEPICFGYSSKAQEEAAYPLVERCAKVLGYDITLE